MLRKVFWNDKDNRHILYCIFSDKVIQSVIFYCIMNSIKYIKSQYLNQSKLLLDRLYNLFHIVFLQYKQFFDQFTGYSLGVVKLNCSISLGSSQAILIFFKPGYSGHIYCSFSMHYPRYTSPYCCNMVHVCTSFVHFVQSDNFSLNYPSYISPL